MKKLLILCILVNISTCVYSQNRTIKGRVIDNDFGTLPYLSIVINDTLEVGKTDLNGFFQVNIPISIKKVSLSYVGFESALIDFGDRCDEIEVVMILSSSYDFMSLKKIDRLRMKEFKKLPELHKEAYNKGLFKTDVACYKQEFISLFKNE